MTQEDAEKEIREIVMKSLNEKRAVRAILNHGYVHNAEHAAVLWRRWKNERD